MGICSYCWGEEITLNTYYPSPSGKYYTLKVKDKMVIGDKSLDEVAPGFLYLEGVIFNQLDAFPSDPVEGEVIWIKNPKDNTKKIWTYNEEKWTTIPFFPLTTIKIKVETNLTNINICGVPVSINEWNYCLLGPELIDLPDTREAFSVYRECDLDSCKVKAEGVTGQSIINGEHPYAEIDIELYESEGFTLTCYRNPSHCGGGYTCQRSGNLVHGECINDKADCTGYSCSVSPFLQLLYAPD